jgi:hypothetical protein
LRPSSLQCRPVFRRRSGLRACFWPSHSNVDKIVCQAIRLLAACLISSLALAGLFGAVARLVRLVNDEVVLLAVAHLRMWAFLDVKDACRLLFLDVKLVI